MCNLDHSLSPLKHRGDCQAVSHLAHLTPCMSWERPHSHIGQATGPQGAQVAFTAPRCVLLTHTALHPGTEACQAECGHVRSQKWDLWPLNSFKSSESSPNSREPKTRQLRIEEPLPELLCLKTRKIPYHKPRFHLWKMVAVIRL